MQHVLYNVFSCAEGSSDVMPPQASPLRPRRFTLGPTCPRGGGQKRDRDNQAVHLQWLVSGNTMCVVLMYTIILYVLCVVGA